MYNKMHLLTQDLFSSLSFIWLQRDPLFHIDMIKMDNGQCPSATPVFSGDSFSTSCLTCIWSIVGEL